MSTTDKSSACPPLSILRSIGDEDLPKATFAYLESHVESCTECQCVLQKWADADRIAIPEEDSSGAADTGLHAFVPDIPGFRIVRELGRGGEGVVYLADEVETQRPVALKFIPGGWLTGPKGRSRWIRQVRATAKVRHPNVVRLYRIEETSQWYLMVLEYIAGGTLRDRAAGPIAPRDAAKLVHTLALAVDEIHRAGFLHLDLKPSNILMDGPRESPLGECVPKISDFGISRLHDLGGESTLSDSIGRGTPGFMAPEQADGDRNALGPAADVYGLGAILYYLLTGKAPFQGKNLAEVLDRLRFESPVAPGEIVAGIDPALESICGKAMRKSPEQRYTTAGELAEALECWVSGGNFRGLPIFESNDRHSGRKVRRPSRITGIAALAAACFALVRYADFRRVPQVASTMTTAEWIQELGQVEPNVFSGQRLDRLIEASREQTEILLRNEGDNWEKLSRTGMLLQSLASRFNSSNSRSLYERETDLLECALALLNRSVVLRPNDQALIREAAITEISLGLTKAGNLIETPDTSASILADKIAHLSNGVDWLRRIEDPRIRAHLSTIVLDKCRTEKFDCEWRGLEELRSKWITFHEHCEEMFRADAEVPRIALRIALFHRRYEALSSVDPQYDPADRSILCRESIMYLFGDLIFLSIGDGTNVDDKTVESALANASKQLSHLRLSPDLLPTIVYEDLIRPVASVSSRNRARGRADLAESAESAYLKLCMAVRDWFPDRFEAYMGLSEAYLQRWKNLLRREDPTGAEAALRQSLDMARRASELSPADIKARQMQADREQRLARFRAGN